MNTATQHEEELFDEARRLGDPATRREFLDRTCADNPVLRTQLEELITMQGPADTLLAPPPPPSFEELDAYGITLRGVELMQVMQDAERVRAIYAESLDKCRTR